MTVLFGLNAFIVTITTSQQTAADEQIKAGIMGPWTGDLSELLKLYIPL